MKNWREYVGYQVINKDDFKDTTKPIKAFYLTKLDDDGKTGFRILTMPFTAEEVTLTDDEVGARVEELLNEFPHKEIKNDIELERAKIQVAKDSGRASAQTNYNNIWFYKGAGPAGGPIIVCGIDDKYIVLKHPNFKKYGFNIKKVSE